MKTVLDTLHAERIALENKLGGLKAEQKQIRAEMERDPMKRAANLAPKFGSIGTQIEVFTAKLGEVKNKIEAEKARLSSPEVRTGIKRAEKIAAAGLKTRDEITAQLEAIITRIDAAISESHEAAGLLRNGARDFAPHAAAFAELSQIRQALTGWVNTRANQQAHTAAMKQLAAAKIAQAAAKVKAEADQAAKIEAARKEREEIRKRHDAPNTVWARLGIG
jgi:chromosome segregation ATPase